MRGGGSRRGSYSHTIEEERCEIRSRGGEGGKGHLMSHMVVLQEKRGAMRVEKDKKGREGGGSPQVT